MTKKTINFIYRLDDRRIKVYPFRVGDIVKVTESGCMYSRYKEAFKYFTGSTKTPYYCDHGGTELDNVFKIIAMIGHPNSNDIVTYCKDRLGNDIVIDADGFTLVRQCPLRVGEKITIHLDRLKK